MQAPVWKHARPSYKLLAKREVLRKIQKLFGAHQNRFLPPRSAMRDACETALPVSGGNALEEKSLRLGSIRKTSISSLPILLFTFPIASFPH